MAAQRILNGACKNADTSSLKTNAAGVWEYFLGLIVVYGDIDVG